MELAAEQALVQVARELDGDLELSPVLARLPVELDVSVPIRDFRVRDLLALEAFVARQSRGLPIAPPDDPRLAAARAPTNLIQFSHCTGVSVQYVGDDFSTYFMNGASVSLRHLFTLEISMLSFFRRLMAGPR